MNFTNITYNNLNEQERIAATQRLTALWAFIECGLGGVLHALQMPFTGLLVGGFAVIIITFIAQISGKKKYKQILKSLLIVLIVKAMVSPHTPFPAYIAVSFQGFIGFVLYSFLGINFYSIFLLATITMIESAIQKLIILTLFFGKPLWKSVDVFISFIVQQIGLSATHGSEWVISIYLLIYLAGGIFIGWVAYKTLKNFSAKTTLLFLSPDIALNKENITIDNKRKNRNKSFLLIAIPTALSIILFLFAANEKEAWMAVFETISWTLTAIIIWYLLLNPVITKFIQFILLKRQSRYNEDVLKTLSFLPVIRLLSIIAWKKSAMHKGWERWQYFIAILLYWLLTYSNSTTEPSLKKQG